MMTLLIDNQLFMTDADLSWYWLEEAYNTFGLDIHMLSSAFNGGLRKRISSVRV